MHTAALFMLAAIVLSLYLAPVSAAGVNETAPVNQSSDSSMAIGHVYVTVVERPPKYELFGIGLVTGNQFDFGELGELLNGLYGNLSEFFGLG
jgi:hypothetical protein